MRPEWRSYSSRVASAGSGRGPGWRGVGATALKRSHSGSGLTCVQGLGGSAAGALRQEGARGWGRSMEQCGGSGKVEPLAVGDSQGPQKGEILVARDPLGDDRGADSLSEA